MERPEDWRKHAGRPHDFIGVDEGSMFLRMQIDRMLPWNRTTIRGQRCRMVITSNPPIVDENGKGDPGIWLKDMFAPWLDKEHRNPAKPGELRWFVIQDGKDVEVEDDEPIIFRGRKLYPKSRTFIPANVRDNPYLFNTGYESHLAGLPDELREALLEGRFDVNQFSHAFQLIPNDWIDKAQARWTQYPSGPPTCLGVDVARGGRDKTVITIAHGTWFRQIAIPGKQTPDGPSVTRLIMSVLDELKAIVPVYIDSIGVGGSPFDDLRYREIPVIEMNATRAATATDKTGTLKFKNSKAWWCWSLREALDPVYGQGIAIPPDRELRDELASFRYGYSDRSIHMQDKDDIKARIGRSPDKSESLIYAWSGRNMITPDMYAFGDPKIDFPEIEEETNFPSLMDFD